jgi:ClpP class serine protease
MLARPIEDAVVPAIMLDIDGPGAEVAGSFVLVVVTHAARGAKPIRAVLNEATYSAAYAIAPAADRITLAHAGAICRRGSAK